MEVQLLFQLEVMVACILAARGAVVVLPTETLDKLWTCSGEDLDVLERPPECGLWALVVLPVVLPPTSSRAAAGTVHAPYSRCEQDVLVPPRAALCGVWAVVVIPSTSTMAVFLAPVRAALSSMVRSVVFVVACGRRLMRISSVEMPSLGLGMQSMRKMPSMVLPLLPSVWLQPARRCC